MCLWEWMLSAHTALFGCVFQMGLSIEMGCIFKVWSDRQFSLIQWHFPGRINWLIRWPYLVPRPSHLSYYLATLTCSKWPLDKIWCFWRSALPSCLSGGSELPRCVCNPVWKYELPAPFVLSFFVSHWSAWALKCTCTHLLETHSWAMGFVWLADHRECT